MRRHREREEKAPPGGWLGPPSTEGLPPLATAIRAGKNGKWKWREHDLTPKQEKKHKRFQRAMKQADKDGEWNFEW